MAEEAKEKLLEVEATSQRIEDLKKRVAEMADYVKIDERRARLRAAVRRAWEDGGRRGRDA